MTVTDEDSVVIPQVMMLQGLPASGKTTHARELVEMGNWVRVNKDDLRAMMDSGKHSHANEKRVLRIRNAIIVDALANGKNVVVDDTNFAPFHTETLKILAKQHGAKFHIRFFDTDMDECIRRNAQRGDLSVPTHVIVEMYNQYLKPLKTAENGSEEEIEGEEATELPECIIVDVDGTLAHIDSDNPRNVYDASRAMEDILDDAVSSVVGMAYDHGYQIVIFTGRTRAHQEVTEKWLQANGVNYDEIHTRKDNDKRCDTIVKREMYEAFVKDKYKVKYVIDDRPKVVRMWQSLGLKTFIVGNPWIEF